MNNHDSLIIKVIYSSKRPSRKFILNKEKYPNITNYLKCRYEYYDNIREVLDRIKFKQDKRPLCELCGKPTKYKCICNNILEYSRFCSIVCSNKHNHDIGEITKERKYGDKNYCNPLKIVATKLERYGNSKYTNKEKSKETCLKKYGVVNYAKTDEYKEKYKETCLEKYGVDNYAKTNECKEKSKETCLKKYGIEYSFQNENNKEKSKNTCLEKYGVDNYAKTNECKEKSKETCLKKYGVDNYAKTNECKQKIINTSLIRYGVVNPGGTEYAQQKIQETKRKNHTFNTSKPEEELYLYIKEKFPNVKRQYKDKERYPWCCDFYIPELDCFIELNGNWTHGKHAFSSTSKEDLYIVEQWKKRSVEHHYYSNAIKTWTICDVKKRNKAKEEKLNFYEFWNLENAKKFIDEL